MVAPIDAARITRLSEQLGRAAVRADEGLREIHYLRSGTSDLPAVRAILDDARTQLAEAAAAIEPGSWLDTEAARAVDALHETIGIARRSRTRTTDQRVTFPLKDAIAGAGRVSRLLDQVVQDVTTASRDGRALGFSLEVPPTTAWSRSELERILVRPNAELTDDEVRRVALVADLPNTMRPPIDERSVINSPLSSMIRAHDMQERFRLHSPLKSGSDRELNRIRLSVETPRLAANPRVTAEQAIDEMVDILVRPNKEIETEHLHELALLASHPDGIRPSLPADAVSELRRSYVNDFRPSSQAVTYVRFQELRTHLFATYPEQFTQHVRTRVDAGLPISADLMLQLERLDADALATHGLTREQLLGGLLRVAGTGDADGFGWGLDHLLAARRIAGELTPDEQLRPWLDQLRTTLDAEIGSVGNKVRPDMSRLTALYSEHWPDFGQIGRMVSTADLMHNLGPAAREAEAVAAATAETATTVVW